MPEVNDYEPAMSSQEQNVENYNPVVQKSQEQLINDIILERGKRVGEITARMDHLRSLKKKLKKYEELRCQIIDSKGELKTDGPFVSIFTKNPDMLYAVKDADSSELAKAIDEQLKVLERLGKRFERKTISIQIFGLAGNGKSRFIQTISGLDDNTVLTSEGNHTTGATTYIQNSDRFEAHIYGYTRDEMLDIFNSRLKTVLYNCGQPEKSITSLSEIGRFDYSKYGIEDRKGDADTLPIRQYIDNYQSVIDTIDYIESKGTLDEATGRKFIKLEEQADVQEYVAHHNGKSGTKYKEHSKFLAVKYARLFNKFDCGEAAKIELMDTVGLGNMATQAQVLENMYDAIEENSDMVVQIFCPPADATWRGFFEESAKCMRNIHYSDTIHRIERIPNDALFFVVNKKKTEVSDNTVSVKKGDKSSVEQVCEAWRYDNYPETLLVANCADVNDVRENVMMPILKRMTECLSTIDQIKSADADIKSKALYQKYREFVGKMNEVLFAGSAGNNILNLIKLFDDIFDADIHGELKKVMMSARENMLRPAGVLKYKLREQCNVETTKQILDKDTQLKHIVDEGIRLHHSYHVIYDDAAAYLRLSIPNRFRSIDNDLQQQIAEKKANVFKCLYKVGRMSAIMPNSGDDSLSENELINDWAARFASEILNDKEYPFLTRLFNNLLNFTINTEGFLLYRIVKHLDVFDTNYIDTVPAGFEKPGVVAHLRQNMNGIFTKITEELDDFTKAPNEAIYFAVEEFFYSLMFDPNCRKEMQKLYFTYQRSVWQKELENQTQQTNAFEDWQKVRDAIKEFDKSAKF